MKNLNKKSLILISSFSLRFHQIYQNKTIFVTHRGLEPRTRWTWVPSFPWLRQRQRNSRFHWKRITAFWKSGACPEGWFPGNMPFHKRSPAFRAWRRFADLWGDVNPLHDIRQFQCFRDEFGRSGWISKQIHSVLCSGQSYIIQPPFLFKRIPVLYRQNQVKHRIVLNSARETVPVAGKPQDDHIIRFQAFRPVDGRECYFHSFINLYKTRKPTPLEGWEERITLSLWFNIFLNCCWWYFSNTAYKISIRPEYMLIPVLTQQKVRKLFPQWICCL